MSAEQINNLVKSRRWYWFLAAMIIVSAGVYAIYHAKSGAPAKTGGHRWGSAVATPIQAYQVKTGDLNVYLTGLGTVSASNSVVVHARVNGLLQKILFSEGQSVKQGQLLAIIDPAPFEVSVSQASGQLARDLAQLTGAQQDLARYKTLLAQESISKQQFDQQTTLVKQYAGSVKADQAALNSARLQLSYSKITAPAAGKVGLRQVDAGNMLNTSDANGLVVINQFSPISLLFTIPENDLPALLKQINAGKTLSVDAFDRAQSIKLASGTLLTLDNQIDTATGTIKLKATFPNQDGALFPNQFVNARLLVETLHNAILLPSAAVQRGSKGTFVFVVSKENTVKARAIKLGALDGDNVAVESGLKAGETVVLDGADKLKQGAKVEIISAKAMKPSDHIKKHTGHKHNRA